MKQLFKLFLISLFMLFSLAAYGAEEVYKTAKFGASYNSKSVNSYTDTWYSTYNGFRVDITNANNNQNGWNYIKFGRKNNASVGTIITNASIDKKVTKVCITVGGITASKITSITLYKSTNKSSWISVGTYTKATGTQTVIIKDANQADNLYYKIEFVCTSGSSNGLIQINQVDYYVAEEETPCDSVTVTLAETLHGTANISKNKVCPGEDITVTYTPDDGYMFDRILANDIEVDNPIEITDNTIIQVLFKEIPPEPTIDIARWDTNAVYINIDNFEGATAVIENQNTQAHIEENIATELFFSKYFEAQGGIKLLGIYNGTKDSISLSTYSIKVAQGTKTTVWGGTSGNYIYALNGLGYIHSNEEIILISHTTNDPDPAIISCILEENPKGLDYQLVGSGQLVHTINNVGLQFSGDDAVGLFKSSTLIDIIGAGNASAASVSGLTSSKTGTDLGHYHDDYCWIATNSEDTLSTNLCLLIRKNTVHSGDTAVKYNTTNFITLATEWIGKQVIKDNTSTCHNFDYVGTYNYNEYYAKYDTIFTEQPLPSIQEDGTYKIEIPHLDTLSCTNLKIIVKDSENKEIYDIFKIPIFVYADTLSNDELFTKEGDDCADCDVIIMHNAVLEVTNTLKNGKVWNNNRNVKIYEGGRLVVPTGQIYNINSLSLRRTDNDPAYLTLKGTINITQENGVYLDVYTDNSEWRWLALPDTFNTANIRLSNGKKPIIDDDYVISWYDGYHRSRNYSGGWKYIDKDTIFNPGEGFLLGINSQYRKEYRFTFNNNVLTEDNRSKMISGLRPWGCDNTELRPNHKGWNMIGNPFMDIYTAEIFNAIRIGYLIKDYTEGHWNGQWMLCDTTIAGNNRLRYAVIPSDDPTDISAGGYKSVLLDDIQLKPFECFFVQIGGTNESSNREITLSSSHKRSIVRRYVDKTDEEVFLRVFVNNWKTGFFISNYFSDDFEPGDDIESRYPIYQTIGGYKLLYSAINDSIIENGVHIYSPGGSIILDDKVNRAAFEYIYIKQGDYWYDMLNGEYDIDAGEFIIYAKVKREDITTTNTTIYINSSFDILYDILGRRCTNGKGVYIMKNGNSIMKIIR